MGRRAGDFAGFCWWMFCGLGCLVGLRSWSLHVLHGGGRVLVWLWFWKLFKVSLLVSGLEGRRLFRFRFRVI